MTTRRICALAMLIAVPAFASPRVPPGYFIDEAQLAAERPIDRVEASGDFTMSIHRKYPDKHAAHLLDIAEATYPPRDDIIQRALERNQVMGSDTTKVSVWWSDGSGVSRMPYAVTAGALDHYTSLTERFRMHNFRGAWDRNLFWTNFSYEASIAYRDHYYMQDTTLTNVYVAEMGMSWSFDDGTFVPVCNAHRFVILTSDGSVLYVQGDGYTDEQVYMSEHRGIGRVETLSR